MMWWMMAADAAGATVETGQSRREASMTMFSIPDERDEEFADFMFSRKSSCSAPMDETLESS